MIIIELKVCVIGTVFIDFKGFPCNVYNPLSRNLGNVDIIHGGVGRNIAESLSYLGLPVSFVSTVDRSAIGKEVVDRLNKCKIDTSFVLNADSDGMGMWLAILDENGELAGSISKMPNLGLLENFILDKCEYIIKNNSHVVLELDLNSTITRKVVEVSNKMQKPVYGIPGNLDIVLKNLDILKNLECFICNDIEAGKIIGRELSGLGIEQLVECLSDTFFNVLKSSRYMVVTLGERGSIYFDAENGHIGYQPAIPTKVVDTSGAGDAFFSGAVMGLISNKPLNEAAICGTKVASYTISHNENICKDLCSTIVSRH